MAVDGVGPVEGGARSRGFIRTEYRDLAVSWPFVIALVVAATLVSALAWSGVFGLSAFVPLEVWPCSAAARRVFVRGLIYEYFVLTAVRAYVSCTLGIGAWADTPTGREAVRTFPPDRAQFNVASHESRRHALGVALTITIPGNSAVSLPLR